MRNCGGKYIREFGFGRRNFWCHINVILDKIRLNKLQVEQ